ncbi:hypothetical protein EYB53_004325 [Candidatus Chloroploca sp. M-50]|uniref:Uncharacterized protein n=1 Tax=Candidatus Chloroploca mongolica TaxID=2528176 RepID=A0ABS4D688_9CHLR|nr:hypothetical protein [Candidatus Chloroploca mongolica]MBP1464930.1 hypothetical protein [Candidatus Chloroploca mongolica]
MKLDAPVQCYLPWFRVADPQVTAQLSMLDRLLARAPSGAGWQAEIGSP